MKTIGVITMYRRNYGAFLQAYALQKKLEEYGYHAELIRYDYYKDRSLLEIPLCNFKTNFKGSVKALIVTILRYSGIQKRKRVFDKSIEKNLKESKKYYRTYSALKKDPPVYDIYLTGSDQVFNPNLTPHASPSRLLCFANSGKKVSYAASAGTTCFFDSHDAFLCEQLSKFQFVSVREEPLRQYLMEKHKILAQRHIDPTLLLSAEEWLSFSCSQFPKNGYILYYRISKQKQVYDAALRLSKETGLPVLVADGKDSFPTELKKSGILSPEEWVGAFVNAAYVVTNSFHGTAFSINFHKKALVVLPPKNQERIENLLLNCKLNRLLDPTPISDEEAATMFEEADSFFDKERERAKEYLLSMGE